MSRAVKGLLALVFFSFFLQGCLLTKEERIDRRSNRKLDKLTTKYPRLLEKDTIIDTVFIPEISIDTVIQTSQDVSGVDSILLKFNNRLDSVTSLQLGDQIKYYITNRQVIADTMTHEEDGVTVKIWQEGDIIQVRVFKPAEKKIVKTAYDKIVRAPEIPWYKEIALYTQKWGTTLLILLIIIWLFLRGLGFVKKMYTKGK